MISRIIRKTPLALAVSTALLASQGGVLAYESPVHTFSVNDVMGGFDGSTFGPGGANQVPAIICGIDGGVACPEGYGPVVDKQGVTLYPVDSEFGFYVVDFLGAVGKIRDGEYAEGYVGNFTDANGSGIKIANAPTLKYRVKPPLGTWCQGLGGTAVKCETEHYTVMEHVLSCHETIPYNPLSYIGDTYQGDVVLSFPSIAGDARTFDCANAPLDDNALILVDGVLTDRLVNATPCEAENDPVGCQMFPNDKTDTKNNVALSTDYSVQLKDDGKPLYGWGGMHKRPNDLRLYAKLALPEEWKAEGANYQVTKAQLVVNHWITNNPNDQLRPEDLENEAATGRTPSYRVEGTPGTSTEIWKSTKACYEGDGHLIDTEEGIVDATFLDTGTIIKNMPYALDPAATPGTLADDDPYAFSSDLYGGLTNGFYTTINREPFEWSYLRTVRDTNVFNFIGCDGPAEDATTTCYNYDENVTGSNTQPVYATDGSNLELVSGPRWRLKPGKFGQDLPSLEIPLRECSQPPFKSDNIKYNVGDFTTTTINLLDWDEEEGPSPLATSKGWVDYTQNPFITVDPATGLSSNGIPMSDDFDLAVYVKGDAKSTAVYNAKLVIEYGEITNTGPTAVADTATVACGSSVLIDVLNNDTDPNEDELTITGFTQPMEGDVGPDELTDGLIYTSTGECGIQDEFEYTISDGNGGTDTGTVTVTVAPDVATGYDLSIDSLDIAEIAQLYTLMNNSVTVRNAGPETITGDVTVVGTNSLFSGLTTTKSFSFTDLAAGETQTFDFDWYVTSWGFSNLGIMEWTATVTPDTDDNNPANNTTEAATTIVRYPVR